MSGAHSVVGVVGLGLVGQALGARLRSQGWRTLGWDLRAQARDAFVAAGGQCASSLKALGQGSSQVLLAVFDTAGVVQVCEGTATGSTGHPGTNEADEADEANGTRSRTVHEGATAALLAPGHRVHTLIDCSTGDPKLLAALAARLAARGVAFIESPLSGSSQQIEAGEATALLGGEAAALAQSAELLQAIAAQRLHVGTAGAGARAKLATNLVLGLNRAVLAEGLAFAEALGIAPELFMQLVLATPARSAAAEVKGAQMVAGDFAPRSRIRQHLKDVELMLTTARQAGQSLPFSEAHAALLREAVQCGEGELDNAAIVLRLRGRHATE